MTRSWGSCGGGLCGGAGRGDMLGMASPLGMLLYLVEGPRRRDPIIPSSQEMLDVVYFIKECKYAYL